MFVLRSRALTSPKGIIGVVCPFVWMYLSSYRNFRRALLENGTFLSMIRLEYNAFEPACVPVSTWTYSPYSYIGFQSTVIDLSEFKGHETQSPRTLDAVSEPAVNYRFTTDCRSFLDIASAPFAYSLSRTFKNSFRLSPRLGDVVEFAGALTKPQRIINMCVCGGK